MSFGVCGNDVADVNNTLWYAAQELVYKSVLMDRYTHDYIERLQSCINKAINYINQNKINCPFSREREYTAWTPILKRVTVYI